MISTTMACNVTHGFWLSAFVLELWLPHLDDHLGPLQLKTEAPIVDCLGTSRFHLYCRTATKQNNSLIICRLCSHYSA